VSGAREAILGAVRQALSRVPAAPSASGTSPARPAFATPAERMGRFQAKLEGVGGKVHRVADAAAAAVRLGQLRDAGGWSEVAVSDEPLVAEVTSACGIEGFDGGSDRKRLEACDVGVTTAQYAIGETGTLVLLSHAERHRLTSLLPPVHVALVPAERVVDGLGDALAGARTAQGGAPPPLVTLITGPSRTGDIELQMVMGVHGPRDLHVILIGEPS
jgi:L-lactate utilization protein LutC